MALFFLFMRTILITLTAALVAVALMMTGLGIKILLKKRGQFKRHCSSIDPYTGEASGCVCGKAPANTCHSKTHTPLEVNQNLLEEL